MKKNRAGRAGPPRDDSGRNRHDVAATAGASMAAAKNRRRLNLAWKCMEKLMRWLPAHYKTNQCPLLNNFPKIASNGS